MLATTKQLNRAPSLRLARRRLACMMLVGLCGISHGEESAKQELVQEWKRLLPSAGAIHVHIQESATGQRFLAGYEFQSGAFYKAFSTYVGGTDTLGSGFDGRPVEGSVRPRPLGSVQIVDPTLDQFLPFVAALDFLTYPGLIQDVTRTEDGFMLSTVSPHGLRRDIYPANDRHKAPQRVLYHFDKQGRLTEVENYCGSGTPMRWEYRNERFASYGVASDVSLGTRQMIDFRYDPKANPEDFSSNAVERLSVAAALIEGSQPLWFGKPIASLTPRTRDGNPAPLPPVTMTPAQAAAQAGQPPPASTGWLQWFLIGGGAAAVALAVWVKRRGA